MFPTDNAQRKLPRDNPNPPQNVFGSGVPNAPNTGAFGLTSYMLSPTAMQQWGMQQPNIGAGAGVSQARAMQQFSTIPQLSALGYGGGSYLDWQQPQWQQAQLAQLLAMGGGALAPQQQQQLPGQSIDQWMVSQLPNVQYLQNIAQGQGAGSPYDTTNVWQSMVDAQQRQIQQNQASLMEMFNASGNYQSTPFANAAVDYMSQVSKDQNALLAQLQQQSWENAAGRQYGAASSLAGFANAGAGQLSGQDFASQMAQYQASLQAALGLSGGSDQALQLLSQYGYGAEGLMNTNSAGALGNMYNTSNNALQSMYGSMMGLIPSYLQYDTTLRGLGLTGANYMTGAEQGQLGLGNQLGTTQYGTLQQQLNNQYQEWLRTQSQYNPLLPYFSSAATTYPQLMYPTMTPSTLSQVGSILGGAGSFLGALPGIVDLGSTIWDKITGKGNTYYDPWAGWWDNLYGSGWGDIMSGYSGWWGGNGAF